jgi:hypothetical protein
MILDNTEVVEHGHIASFSQPPDQPKEQSRSAKHQYSYKKGPYI